MTKAPSRFPLQWPPGKPRRKPAERQRGQFSSAGKRISIQAAAERLEEEVERLGGSQAVLSTNLETRLDGRPRADRTAPADPGVCVYFSVGPTPYAMACDTFDEVAQNIAALAEHIQATRRIERYGVASAAETLKTFEALPAPTTWRDTLGFSVDWPGDLSMEEAVEIVGARYRNRARVDGADVLALNLARDAAKAELKATP